MPYIKTITLNELDFIPHIKDATVGALLQIAPISNVEGPPMVVMLAEMDIGGKAEKGVVVVEGEAAGTLFVDEEKGLIPAFGIDALAHLIIEDPAPRKFGVKGGIAAGEVCRVVDREDNVFLGLAVRLPQTPTVEGYAPLSGPNRGKIIRIKHACAIGRAAVASLKREDAVHS